MNKNRTNKSQCGRGTNLGGNYGRGQGGCRSHSRSADGTCGYSVLLTGKLSRIVTSRITLLVYVGNIKGRGLLASTITMVHPRGLETSTEETSGETVVLVETVSAMKATGVATSHVETIIKYKLTIIYRTSSKNKASTTATMIMLITQSLIGWCLKKVTQ